MDTPKEVKSFTVIQRFCSHCARTETIKKDDPRTFPLHCNVCLQGEMITIVE